VAVRDALARLPQGQRAALVLHYYYEGLSVDTIARTLGLCPDGVKARLSRGRAALQPLLADRQTPPAWTATPPPRRRTFLTSSRP
jgi:RNA polymerase sigma-70 factor (ECF subfamily)